MYWTVTVEWMEVTVPVVKPVVRPLFITRMPIAAVCGVVRGMPTSRIRPLASTLPRAKASAASTLADPRGTRLPAKSPTTLLPVGEQPESTRPGWRTSSPALALPERASTWLLLRMHRTPSRSTSAPSVPEQQNTALRSPTSPPDVPILTGEFCLTWWAAPPSAHAAGLESRASGERNENHSERFIGASEIGQKV